MIYYLWFDGRGRASLADDLEAKDPFGLAPGEIVGRIVAAGYTPRITEPRTKPLPIFG